MICAQRTGRTRGRFDTPAAAPGLFVHRPAAGASPSTHGHGQAAERRAPRACRPRVATDGHGQAAEGRGPRACRACRPRCLPVASTRIPPANLGVLFKGGGVGAPAGLSDAFFLPMAENGRLYWRRAHVEREYPNRCSDRAAVKQRNLALERDHGQGAWRVHATLRSSRSPYNSRGIRATRERPAPLLGAGRGESLGGRAGHQEDAAGSGARPGRLGARNRRVSTSDRGRGSAEPA